jgi:hypothetical protein
MPILLDLRAIHFKYHDRDKHWPIGFQSANPGTTQGDKRFYAYLIIGEALPSTFPNNARGLLPITRMANEPIRLHIRKGKGVSIDVSFYPCTFYTCSAAYKKQGAPYRRPILLLYFLHVQHRVQKERAPDQHQILSFYFLHAQHHVPKARGSWSTSHSILILFPCAMLRTKSKGLLIDVSFYSYTFYMCSAT